MRSYRLLLLDKTGRVVANLGIDFYEDREAMAIAVRKVRKCEYVEVWNGGRPVCVCAKPIRPRFSLAVLCKRMTRATARPPSLPDRAERPQRLQPEWPAAREKIFRERQGSKVPFESVRGGAPGTLRALSSSTAVVDGEIRRAKFDGGAIRRCSNSNRQQNSGAGRRTAKVCSVGRAFGFSGPPSRYGDRNPVPSRRGSAGSLRPGFRLSL
jgi:hypothetical protein